MAEIHRQAFPHDPWDTASFVTLLGQPGISGFIDERGGILLLRIAADEAEILSIGVTTARIGIGRALLTTAITQARAQNAKKLFLEVASTNAAALALYAATGFTQIATRKNYYPNGTDALLLSLSW